MGTKNMTNNPVLPREPKSLDELHQMIAEAAERGRKLSGPIGEVVYIAGAWMVDEGAQIWKLTLETDVTVKDMYPEVPMYLVEKELKTFLREHGSQKSLNMTFEYNLPNSREFCRSC